MSPSLLILHNLGMLAACCQGSRTISSNRRERSCYWEKPTGLRSAAQQECMQHGLKAKLTQQVLFIQEGRQLPGHVDSGKELAATRFRFHFASSLSALLNLPQSSRRQTFGQSERPLTKSLSTFFCWWGSSVLGPEPGIALNFQQEF